MRIDRRLFWILGVIVMIGTAAGLALAGNSDESLCLPLGSVAIEAPAGVAAQRSAVDFPHGQHLTLTCLTCHHKWQGTSENINCTTAGCHDLAEAPQKGSELPAYRYFKNAYHGACVGCHKSMTLKNLAAEKANSVQTVQQQTGPTGCVICHPR